MIKYKKVLMTRRDLLKLGGASMGAALLAACGGNAAPAPAPAEEVEDVAEEAAVEAPAESAPADELVEVVMMYQANEISDDDIAQFNGDYDGINLTRVDVDATRFFAMIASGEAPHLMRSQAPDIPQWVARNIMLDLTPYFNSSDTLSLDDLVAANNYYKAESPTAVGSGPIYGMAKDWAPDNFLWVNETVFENAGVDAPDLSTPVTSEELADIARSVTTKDGDVYATTGFNGHTGFIDRWWMMLAQNAGGSFFNDDFSQANIKGNQAAEDAIAFFHNMAADGAMNSPINPSAAWFGPDFAEGRLAMVYTGYWFHGNALADGNEDFQAAIADGKVKMYPQFTYAGTRSNPCITAAGAVCPASAGNADQAWEVFEWFMGKEPSVARASSGWGLPALKSQLELTPKDGPLSAQAWETVQSELDYAEDTLAFNPFLAGGEPGPMGQVFMQNWEQALNGSLSFDDLVGMIETETNLAIEEGMANVA